MTHIVNITTPINATVQIKDRIHTRFAIIQISWG